MVTKQEDVDFGQLMREELFPFPLMSSHQFEELTDISIIPGTFSDLELSPPRLEDEATMDVAETKFEPVTKFGPPERTVFAGELNFEVQVNSSDVHKRRYLYSSKVNRIYVDMNTNFSMQFVWDFARAPRPMLVRATAVFSDAAQQEKRVERCLQHTHSDNQGLDAPTVRHVLRSTRAAGTEGVFYCGDATRQDSWLSVLVRHDAASDTATAPYSHAYQFVCKNSCSTGINRRAIAVIFTLEDVNGHVYGRQIVGARVCACPRRDMVKDEETEAAYLPGKKRVASNKIKQELKKIKLEVIEDDDAVYTLPAGLQIVGARTLTTSFNVMINMMEQAAGYKKNDPKAQEKYSKAIAGLRSFVDQVSKKDK